MVGSRPKIIAATLRLDAGLSELAEQFDAAGISRLAEVPTDADRLRDVLAMVLDRLNELGRLSDTLSAFVYAFFSTDSYNTTAAREMSKLELLGVRRQKLDVRLRAGSAAWRRGSTSGSPRIRCWPSISFFCQRRSPQPLPDERRARSAGRRIVCRRRRCLWQAARKRHQSAQGAAGAGRHRPSDCRSPRSAILFSIPTRRCASGPIGPNRPVGVDSHDGGRLPERRQRDTAYAGPAARLAERAGLALDDNRIDRPTLDAIAGRDPRVVSGVSPLPAGQGRRSWGSSELRWWDLFARSAARSGASPGREAREFIVEKFGTFSHEMGQYARTASTRRWIDAEPRNGKRGGAFCMSVEGVEESRILANFDGSFDQVSTLAHELGHGYHNHCQRGCRICCRGAPSTLGRDGQHLLRNADGRSHPGRIVPASNWRFWKPQSSGATQVCLDISSRFHIRVGRF